MSTAKDNFVNRIELFDKAINSEPVSTKPFIEVEHNSIANLFRNGLAIIGFTILEDFIKNRIGEIFKEISLVSTPFSRLPLKLQEAATLHAIKSIQFRANILKSADEDWMSFIQQETKFTGSTLSHPYELSAYSLGWDRSNLATKDISNFMSFLNVEGGWNTIQKVSAKANITLASPSETFKNAASRRHAAAHDTTTNSPINDLIDYSSQARIIAFCFDALISRSLKFIRDNDTNFLTGITKTKDTDVKLRFVNQHGANWKEFTEKSNRAIRVNSDLNISITQSRIRALNNNEIVIIKDATNKIVNWYI